MEMKLEEFLKLQQESQTVMQFVGKFNCLSQYAVEHVNTDAKKKRCFMRDLNFRLQTMMTTCTNASYNEIASIAIASEEKYRSTRRPGRGRMFPQDPLVAPISIRGLSITLPIVLHIIHLSSKASSCRMLDPLQILPIHASRMPVVFVLIIHRTMHFPVSTMVRLGTMLRIVVYPSKSMPMLSDHQWISSRIISIHLKIPIIKNLACFF